MCRIPTTEKNASLCIKLEKDDDYHYRPDEEIEGTAILLLPSQYSASHLELQIIGEELTIADEPDTIAEVRRKGQNTICCARSNLVSFGATGDEEATMLQPGKYEYPFKARLPHDIPSSLFCQSRSNDIFSSRCSISYKVSCKLHQERSGKINCGVLPCNSKLPIIAEKAFTVVSIIIPTTRDDDNCVTLPKEDKMEITTAHDVFLCGVFPRGSMDLGLTVDKKSLARGDKVTVNVVFRNNTKRDGVENVAVQMRETVIWKAEDRTEFKSMTLCETILDNKNSGGGDEWCFSLTVPPTTHESYNGHLIMVNHDVRMMAVTSVGCVNHPESIVPVCVESRYADGTLVSMTQRNAKKMVPTTILEFTPSSSRKESSANDFYDEGHPMSVFTACFG